MLVSQWWKATGRRIQERLALPIPPARGSRRVEGFPPLRDGARSQARLGFYFNSWLCRGVAQRLACSAGAPAGGWKPVHLEMALFTLGGAGPNELQLKTIPSTPPPGPIADPVTAAAVKSVAKKAAASAAASEAASRGKDAAFVSVSDQVDRIRAKQRAVKFAQQTGGRLAHLQFGGDGLERWVVFKAGEPIEAFPRYDGDLKDALKHHTRIKTRPPATVRATLPASRARKLALKARASRPRPRLPFRKPAELNEGHSDLEQ